VEELLSSRRLDTAARLCHVLLDQAVESNCATYQAVLTSLQAVICLQRGELDAAAEHSARALKVLPLPGWGVVIGMPLSVLILATTSLGRHEEAASALRHPVPEEMFHTSLGLSYQLARGHHLLATGRYQAALEEFLACGKLDAATLPSLLRIPLAEQWRTGAAESCLRLGRVEEAREWARRQLAEIDDSDDGRATDRAMCLRLLAAASDHSARLGLLRESAKLLRRSGHRPELVRTLADLSLAQREAGDGRRADATWRRAHDLAARCGLVSPPFTVPPPGQEHASPPRDRLSEAELRVASLAVSGRSNREIAAELYITVSTVEQHLTRVYRKMSVRCRADLAKLLDPAEPSRPGERPAHDEPRPSPRSPARSAPRTPPRKAPPNERPGPPSVTQLCAAAAALERGRADPPYVTPDARSTGPSGAPAQAGRRPGTRLGR
jgi:ATP/maltotriose-dependent transcriptional regulator MalT